jgi:hypothetical protein
MGWLNKFLRKIGGVEPTERVFVASISKVDAVIPGIGVKVRPDEHYIELYLESVRLQKARRFATAFQAVAYNFVELIREGEAVPNWQRSQSPRNWPSSMNTPSIK